MKKVCKQQSLENKITINLNKLLDKRKTTICLSKTESSTIYELPATTKAKISILAAKIMRLSGSYEKLIIKNKTSSFNGKELAVVMASLMELSNDIFAAKEKDSWPMINMNLEKNK